jgi:hypothetical protein
MYAPARQAARLPRLAAWRAGSQKPARLIYPSPPLLSALSSGRVRRPGGGVAGG